jgi:hypothetical protein
MGRKYLLAAFVVVVLMTGAVLALVTRAGANGSPRAGAAAIAQVTRGAFVRTLRLTGIIESVRYYNVTAPRLVGVTGPNTLIITKLARGGAQIAAGDLLVEFDRQTQLKAAFDRRAEYLDFGEQIRKKRAEHEQARAKDDAERAVAGNAVETARLELKKNELLPKIVAEKNTLQVEQAQAAGDVRLEAAR